MLFACKFFILFYLYGGPYPNPDKGSRRNL